MYNYKDILEVNIHNLPNLEVQMYMPAFPSMLRLISRNKIDWFILSFYYFLLLSLFFIFTNLYSSFISLLNFFRSVCLSLFQSFCCHIFLPLTFSPHFFHYFYMWHLVALLSSILVLHLCTITHALYPILCFVNSLVLFLPLGVLNERFSFFFVCENNAVLCYQNICTLVNLWHK